MKSRYAVTQRFTAGQNVILTLSGEDKEYSVSGITVFVKKKGLKYGDQFFAADGEELSLSLDHTERTGGTFTGYTADKDTLTGTQNPYTLTMPDDNVTVNAVFDEIEYTIGIPGSSHGSVRAPETAHYNDAITLNVTPEEGYAVRYVKYNDTVILPQNGEYSFRMPPENVTISAQFDIPKDPVSYLDENGKQQSVTVYEVLNGSESTLETGWYVLSSDIAYSGRITVLGDVTLILCDNCTLDAGNGGINVASGNSLTVYAQSLTGSDSAGVLNAKAVAEKYSGFGSGCTGTCGDITISGGTVKAVGGSEGAGIGSGKGGRCGNITITKNVIEVIAIMCENAQSIGNGHNGSCGTITIDSGANVIQN